MLAASPTSRLPSVSLRCSCGISFWSAGHRSVPASWRARVLAGKAACFPGRGAVGGGPYPDAGAKEAGRVIACELADGRAGANSVVRTGIGSNWCPSSSRIVQTHWLMICQASCPQAAWLHQRSGSCSLSSSAHAGAMPIPFDHIASGEEEFVHDACTRNANRTLLFAPRMRCHDDRAPCAIWSLRDRWTIVEAAHHPALLTADGPDQQESADAAEATGDRARGILCPASTARKSLTS